MAPQATRNPTDRRDRLRGVTLTELLVVLALAGIALAVAVPLVADNVRRAEIRAAANVFSTSLRAARMIAVSKRSPTVVTVGVAPDNFYEYIDSNGRLRHFDMPVGVEIVSSTSPITFQSNGSVTGGASTVIEASLTGETDRWTVTTTLLGVSRISHE